ncbi:MAG: hypothetical protein AB7K09_23075 [Planctomycetota bacterium]
MVAYDDEFDDDFEEEDDEEEEFEDDFEDEFADDFEDDDEFASFGPVYIQGETSIGFDAYAMGASTAVVLVALFMMWTMVLNPVYDGLSGSKPSNYDGLGRRGDKVKDGAERISFAPPTIEVLGVGRYDTSPADEEYDYAVLNAGSNQGIGVGLIYTLLSPETGKAHKWMVVVEVDPEMCRADFIDQPGAVDDTLKIDKTYPDNPISHRDQDSVWERETIANLLEMLDDGWRDRGVTPDMQADALERFAALGVPSRSGQPVFRLIDIPSFDGDDHKARATAQLNAFDRLRRMDPKAAADKLREVATEKNFPMVEKEYQGGNKLKVPKTFPVPLPAPMSPVLRKSIVLEALNMAEDEVAQRLPTQFPDLNPEWNLIKHSRVSKVDVTGNKDAQLITIQGKGDGANVYSVGRPKDDVTAYLAPADDQVVIRTVIDILKAKKAEEEAR